MHHSRNSACFCFWSVSFIFCASSLFAEGPDYFRLVDQADYKEATVYRAPTSFSQLVGQLPSGAVGIRNYGCVGGLSFDEWMSATSAEREQSRKQIWCEIEYAGIRGWVEGLYLTEDF